MIRKILLLTLCFILIIPLVHSTNRTPTTTVIPPITAQSAGVELQCFPLQAFPGSVNIGSSGFIRIRCPTTAAIQFGAVGVSSVTLTPTFTLGIGYTNASIVMSSNGGNPCAFNFNTITVTVGNLTLSTGSYLNKPITFGNPPTDPTQLLAGDYDYCLQYTNAPSTGLPGFNIVWT